MSRLTVPILDCSYAPRSLVWLQHPFIANVSNNGPAAIRGLVDRYQLAVQALTASEDDDEEVCCSAVSARGTRVGIAEHWLT